MKFLRCIFLLLPVGTFGQSTPAGTGQPTLPAVAPIAAYNGGININYVRTWVARTPLTSPTATDRADKDKYQQTTTYLDGLGRPLQEVMKSGSPDGTKDIVSTHVYDTYGREAIQYLPYSVAPAAANTGKFKMDPFPDQQGYYQGAYNDQRPYGETVFEASPLDRPLRSFAPGNSWAGSKGNTTTGEHAIQKQYLFNTLADAVYIWTIGYDPVADNNNIPTSPGAYGEGQLYKTVTTDEQGKKVVEFTDKDNHIILKKVQASGGAANGYGGWLCTYYVYDDFGLLRFVMQPNAVQWVTGSNWNFATPGGTTTIAEGCFRYEYDGRHRLIAKKVPGAGWVYMAYDRRDRPVYTQDANMRQQEQWLVSFYDALNRPVSTALYNPEPALSRQDLQNSLDAITGDNPVPALNEGSLYRLTYTYYNDYSFSGAAAFSSAQLAAAQSSYQPGDEWADNSTATGNTKGMVTGTRTRVLDGGNTWQAATLYYDDKGRTIQTIATNHKGGTDVATTQYSFTGRPISTLAMHNNPAAVLPGTQTTTLQQTVQYAGGFTIASRQRINTEAWQPISTVQYDGLGKVKQKQVGNGYEDFDGNAQAFYTHFTYNIRGWLTGINKADYDGLDPIFSGAWFPAIFAQSLSYDYGFSSGDQYNGNISGTEWAHAGDKAKRAYGFAYDDANRLLQADFTQNTTYAWSNSAVNFCVSNLAYDANGNITSQTQYGLKIGGSDIIDQLAYTYPANSNKLQKVADTHDDYDLVLGDFNKGNNTGNTDYSYDANGNLVQDNNKAISSIEYNYLNLPKTITVTGKGTVAYLYDAAGNKLQKKTTEGTVVTTTDYLGAFQYHNNELQQVAHSEGRARYAKRYWRNGEKAYTWVYDYYYKDHLGNVRTTVTEQKDTAIYQATFEINKKDKEEVLFDGLEEARKKISEITGYPYTNETENEYTAKVNGNINNGIGPRTLLKVMAGDSYDLSCISWWRTISGTLGGVNSTAPLIAQLTGMIAGGASPLSNLHGSVAQLSSNTSPLGGAIGTLMGQQQQDYNQSPGRPDAYLNWILLDEQFHLVQQGSGFERVGPYDEYTQHVQMNIPVVKSGYLYVYCSNLNTAVNVYFDNLIVQHHTGPLLQEDDYYPFGLTMQGISSKATGKLENKFGITSKEKQNKEFSDYSGLDWYDFGARMQDPQIGRWFCVDNLVENSFSQSPFGFCSSNPTNLVDLDGNDNFYFNEVGYLIGIFRNNSNVDVAYQIDNESQVTFKLQENRNNFGWGQNSDLRKMLVFQSILYENRDLAKSPFGTTVEYEAKNPPEVNAVLTQNGRGNTRNPGNRNLPIGRWGDATGRVWKVFNRTLWPQSENLTAKNLPTALPTPTSGTSVTLPNGSLPQNRQDQITPLQGASYNVPLTDPNGNIIPYHRSNGAIYSGSGKSTFISPSVQHSLVDINHEPRFIGDYGANLPIWLKK